MGTGLPDSGPPRNDTRLGRRARNEAVLREVNERIAHLADSARAWSEDTTVDLLCECGDEGGCGEWIRVPLGSYETVRAQDDRFVVRPGHETPELEEVVARTEDYVVVDKIAAVEPLVADDPRGAPSS